MANKFTIADMEAHAGNGVQFMYFLDWNSTGKTTILAAGDHTKMRIKQILAMNAGAALNATEPIINITKGGEEIVATIDMASAMGATAAIGVIADLTIVETLNILDVEESLQVEVETADGGSASRCLLMVAAELVE